jgi:purine-binding chemotaxis protein CheW
VASTAFAVSDGPLLRIAPEWVIFGCSGQRFAIPLAQIREILLPQPITRLPGCGPEVCGLIGLRGRILTVFDFGAALGLRTAASVPEHRLLLVEHGGELVAGVVEEVLAVTHAEAPRVLDLDDLLGRLLA